jgi:hypothetical protein
MFYLVNIPTGSIRHKSVSKTGGYESVYTKWYEAPDYQNPVYDSVHNCIIDSVLLRTIRQTAYDRIDAHTTERITRGCTFKGVRFSLSQNAQANWTALNVWRLDGTIPEGGVDISNADNGTYHLAKADVQPFINVIFATVKGELDSGNALKVQIAALWEIEKIQTFRDPRD